MAWIGAAIGLVGSLAASGGSDTQQTSQNKIDPRMEPYIYGKGASPGLLGYANALYQNQMGQGGTNPMMTAGMEMQRQSLMDPARTYGADLRRTLGASLMGGGVAGNPFSGGGGLLGRSSYGQRAMPSSSLQYTPFRYNPQGIQQSVADAVLNPIQQASPPPTPQADVVNGQAQSAVDYYFDQYQRQNQLGPYAPKPYQNDGG